VLVIWVSGEKHDAVLNRILSDDLASRASVISRDASFLVGRSGFYIRVMGTEEQEARAKELVGDDGRIVSGEELEEVVRALKEEDERSLSGMGLLFGGG